MSKIENGGPAFPMDAYSIERGYQYEPNERHGMSLRDYFAAKALQGILASGATIDLSGKYPFEARAITCYMLADAMLKAREG